MIWNANDALPTMLRAISTARWLRVLILVLCALATTSCVHGTQATRPTIPAPLLVLLHPIPPVDTSLTAPCQALPLAADDALPTLLRNHAQVAALYHQCAARMAGLTAQARERERIEAERIARATAALKAEN